MLEGEILNHVLAAWCWDPRPSPLSVGVSEGRHWFLIPKTCPRCHLVPRSPLEGQDPGQGSKLRFGPWGNGGGWRVPLTGDKNLTFLNVWRDTHLLWPLGHSGQPSSPCHVPHGCLIGLITSQLTFHICSPAERENAAWSAGAL